MAPLWLAAAVISLATAAEPGARWWSHVAFLADDKLQGRETGSAGHRKAAQYVAGEFERAGLKPAGASGYFQPVKLQSARLIEARSSVSLLHNGAVEPLKFGDDVIVSTRIPPAESLEAPLVFIGYGLHIPEAGYDDLAGLELTGKIAVFVQGGPASIPGPLRSHAQSREERWKALRAAGAVGQLTIENPRLADIPWERTALNRVRPSMNFVDPVMRGGAGQKIAAQMNSARAEKLFTGTGHTLAEIFDLVQAGKPLPRFPLPYSLRARTRVERTPVESPNVAALLPGSDPLLKDEVVVLSGHLDHLGVGKPINGDSIYNGAMDDASGIASLIDIAQTLRETNARPRRSILFLAVTGEEKGLLGSKYFATHPTIKASNLVADINVDMFLPLFPVKLLTVYGLDESDLGDEVRTVASARGIKVQPDPEPNRNIFIRSDQYSFIQSGVPSLTFKVGYEKGSAEEAIGKRWLKERYHAPSDDIRQPVDLQAAADFNGVMLDLSVAVANHTERPRWKDSSFFKRYAPATPSARSAEPKPAKGNTVADKFVPAPYEGQKIEGMLGDRLRINLEGRLLHVDDAALLAGFQRRPGEHPWIGEHIGKFLHAAVNTWRLTGDARLKTIMDRMVLALIATQRPDGYLGTYTDDRRWTSWDVWVHKYNLIGLLSYYEATGYQPALHAARKVGDLLDRTFGDSGGKRDIIRSGTHVGMAATSVLEPMVMLYLDTGERRYLDFCYYLTRAWDTPAGPKIIHTLLDSGSVYRTANAKAYEMLSNLVGLVELYRVTGDERFLKPAQIAWNDVASRRLFITGTSSSYEHFRDDFDLPGEEGANVGEGCVTVTWLQLSWQLLRITGEAKYADEIERTVYNQLLGAQDPHNGDICYFTPLNGSKHATPGINCCVSSEPRGISMIPQLAWGARDNGVAVWLYTKGEATVKTPAAEVRITTETRFPHEGAVIMRLEPTPNRAVFPLYLRVPAWTNLFTATVGEQTYAGTPGELLKIERVWRRGETIEINMHLTVRTISGGKNYSQFIALQRGPQVLALDRAVNPEVPYLHLAAPLSDRLEPAARLLPADWPTHQAYAVDGIIAVQRPTGAGLKTIDQKLLFVPFADASDMRVWLAKQESNIALEPVALTAFGKETWSRRGEASGSICDERPETYRDTMKEGGPAAEDWYAVEMDEPKMIQRIVYCHGHSSERGGWFDGKPSIQIKANRNGAWTTVAALEDYPVTPGRAPRLRDGQAFEIRLPAPARAIGIRVIGKPGGQYSTCAELAAY